MTKKTDTTDNVTEAEDVTTDTSYSPPMYQNPDSEHSNWDGKGKTPQWLADLEAAGRDREEFRRVKKNRISFKPYKTVGFDGENEIEVEHKYKKPVLKLYNLKLKVKTNTFVEPNTFYLDKDDQADQEDIEAIIDELVEELTSEMMDNIREAVKNMVEDLVENSDPFNNTIVDNRMFIIPFGNVSQSNHVIGSIDRLFSRKPKIVGFKKVD